MKTNNLVESLSAFGIHAAPYKRPPAGKDMFVISILPQKPEGVIQVNQGQAVVEIHGSKKHRQAVITVTEEPRVITRLVKSLWGGGPRNPPNLGQAKARLLQHFPIQVPGNTTWSYAGIKIEKRWGEPLGGDKEKRFLGWTISGKVTARAGKRTVNHFLLGVDESHNFIAPLKEKPASVADAHRILKPKMRAGSLRQGEWFFEPLLKEDAAEIEKRALANGRDVKPMVLGGTTHTAQSTLTVTTSKRAGKPGTRTLYARGYVTDNRKGHHKTLFLPTWHRVVRNKEITFKRRKNAPRRRQSFD